MASDMTVRLLMDSNDYEKKLKKARGSLDDYTKGVNGNGAAIASVGKVLGKFAGAVGVGMTAMEGFEKVMKSSQTLGDKWASTMSTAKTVVDEFFFSIGHGSFHNFLNGLDNTIDKAKKAYEAMDVLGNTQISYGVLSAREQSNIADAQYLAKNKFAPMDVRLGAFEQWKSGLNSMMAANQQLGNDLIASVVADVAARTGVAMEFTLAEIEKALMVDLDEATRGEKRLSAKRGVEAYMGWAAAHPNDVEGNKKVAEGLREQFLIHTLLEKASDEELQAIAEKIKQYYALNAALKSTAREYNETANEFNNANKTMKGYSPVESLEGFAWYGGGAAGGSKSSPAAGSLAALDAAIKAAQEKYANAVSDEARRAALQTLNELQGKKVYIEFIAKFPNAPGNLSGSGAGLPTGGVSLPSSLGPSAPITKDNVTTMNDYASAISSVANALTAVNTANVEGAQGWLSWAGSVMTASASAVEAISKIVAAKTAEAAASGAASAAMTPFVGWLMVGGAVASVLSAMAAIPNFADGGVVPGSNYMDGITARVSSGEMVINEADQKRLFDSIHGGGIGGQRGGRSYITGEQIVTVVNNYGRRTGRGEILV